MWTLSELWGLILNYHLLPEIMEVEMNKTKTKPRHKRVMLLEKIRSMAAIIYQKVKYSKTLLITCVPLTSYLAKMPLLYNAQFESQLQLALIVHFAFFF